MRPDPLRDYLVDLAKNAAGVQQVRTLAEAGDTKHPCGLAINAGGREQRWQIMGQLADGEKHDTPTAEIEGQPAAFTPAAVTDSPDAWLASVLGAAESPHIERLDVWSARPEAKPDYFGITVYYYNGSKSFVRAI
ncbi:hypothetical protein [Streptomyces sp. NPDC005385]|uniref:hypothetical protein n=1 Tax=unclassified Streptomyces TaxID=2593676 RepID=UPI0033B1F6D1